MATLPDLTTSNVSFVGYFNTIEQGGGSTDLDPETALTYSDIDSYTLYDNGFDANVSFDGGLPLNVRLKTDGWCVAYLPRGNTYTGYNNHSQWTDLAPSEYQVMTTRTTFGYRTNIHSDDITLLSKTIQNTINELDSSGTITFNHTDVGIYNYAYPDQSNLSMFSLLSDNNEGEQTMTHVRANGTTVPYAATATGSRQQGGNLKLNGTKISDASGESVSVDMTTSGDLPDEGGDVTFASSQDNTIGAVYMWS